MKASINTGHRELNIDLSRPMPISIRLRHGDRNPVAWYAAYPKIEAVEMDGFVGNVKRGGSVNTNDIQFNPHGNGTHTECIGHLTQEAHELDEFMREFFFVAQVITVSPEVMTEDESEFRKKGDKVITLNSLGDLKLKKDIKALIIRTTPNESSKLTQVYTGDNPAYIDELAMHEIRKAGIDHFLVDLPSVDRENDGGEMKAHRAFWYEQNAPRMHATITEMVYVPDQIQDGEYVVNIMIAPFGNDASPSKPVLYSLLPT